MSGCPGVWVSVFPGVLSGCKGVGMSCVYRDVWVSVCPEPACLGVDVSGCGGVKVSGCHVSPDARVPGLPGDGVSGCLGSGV